MQRQLRRGETPAERLATSLAYIYTAANRMRAMTQDLLDASLQQSGHGLNLLLAPTELVALTRQAVGEHELVSGLHQFHFQAHSPRLDALVDEIRIHRILANLLSNAIKYSPGGGIVSVTIGPDDGPDGTSAVLLIDGKGSTFVVRLPLAPRGSVGLCWPACLSWVWTCRSTGPGTTAISATQLSEWLPALPTSSPELEKKAA
jgi:signal transduction histidine kinase